jgi:hypothetical protein
MNGGLRARDEMMCCHLSLYDCAIMGAVRGPRLGGRRCIFRWPRRINDSPVPAAVAGSGH